MEGREAWKDLVRVEGGKAAVMSLAGKEVEQ